MTYPPGAPGEDPRQQPFAPPDADSGAVEYPPIEYHPTPPPGYSLPPAAPHPGYLPPQNYGPPPGYPAPPNYGPPPGYGVPPGQSTTNGLAIGSLVCGLASLPGYIFCLGFPLGVIAIVLGIVALNQIDPASGQKGKEMAIAGIVVGGLGLLGLGALVVFGLLPTL